MSPEKRNPSIPTPRVGIPPYNEVPRFKPIKLPAPPEQMMANLEKYVNLVLELGATEAMIIRAGDVPQDMRAHYSCLFPRCRWFKSSPNCSLPRWFTLEEAKEVANSFSYAVAYKVPAPVWDKLPDVGEINLRKYWPGRTMPDKEVLVRNIARLRNLDEIARKIDQAAYYDSCYLNSPMGSGPCLVTFCAAEGECIALGKGEFCKYNVKNYSPGQENMYIDFHGLARMLGWGEMQPGGNCAFPEDTPPGFDYFNMGLVFLF